jgi:hypothetical protein
MLNQGPVLESTPDSEFWYTDRLVHINVWIFWSPMDTVMAICCTTQLKMWLHQTKEFCSRTPHPGVRYVETTQKIALFDKNLIYS